MPFFHHDKASTASSSSSSPPRHSRHDTSPVPPTEPRRTGLFGSRHTTSPSPRNSTSSTNNSSNIKHSNSLLRRNNHHHHHGREDPSITAAREQVVLAETSETNADRALIAARQAVRDAREHVRRLEHEAKEEARLAKIKQDQAASISKRARPLGRLTLNDDGVGDLGFGK